MSNRAPMDLRRATRGTARDTYIGGVASGLARHLGLPVLWVRAAFVLLSVLSGFGVILYAAFWLVLPTGARFVDEAPGLASATRTGKRPSPVNRRADLGPLIAIAAVAIGVIFVIEAWFGQGAIFWPVLLAIGGIGLLWRQADEAQRERWLDATGRMDPVRVVFGRGGWAAYARVAAGVLLIVGAIVVFGAHSVQASVLRDVAIAALLGIIGLAITVGPWVFRLASDLSSERAERVRSQERADLAAHLHDSVLQTLALIQKNSADGATVARLARAQERDLRQWLFAEERADEATLAGALRSLAAEVEDGHGVPVEVVTVGDTGLTEGLQPLSQATREAVTNAAKHSGADKVDVYAEVSSAAVEVFVRDRGVGFDPEVIEEDRYGVRRSIVDRMQRHGGSAEVRSTTGEGTEVRLHMPLEEDK